MAKSDRPRITPVAKPRRGRPPREFGYIPPSDRSRYGLMRELLVEIEHGRSVGRLYAGLLAEHLMARHPKLERKFRGDVRRLRRPRIRSVVEE